MNTSLRLLWAAVLLGGAAIMGATPVRAAAFQDNSYIQVEVPDMGQAVEFFRDVLGCPLIGSAAHATTTRIDQRTSTLLACGSGSVVELSLAARTPTPTTNHYGMPFQLATDDVSSVAQWLKHQGVEIGGPPQRMASGQLAVNLTTPWGQPLQLVGRPVDVASAGR
ncbi:MAG: VOC family protein [Rhodanobacter sp.]